ncbi:polysaccharide pyruvyl transferase family protein [Pseudoruegeria sp. HB172150]|uniref:polysaccharide pyruvyl transferase family protein n=1 Tax=Pseudoruegeria sp. HB172150 TaxID=2721164 RepID=UPI00155494F2|nr:polysaccharide pyruvyl transferase family protein [Pseudoruegeria sp. HB172150]
MEPKTIPTTSPILSSSDQFLFVGNGPYRNRGCEAIVRGTMKILSGVWGEAVTARAGVMAAPLTVEDQQAGEIDRRVTNFPVSHVGSRLSKKWWMAQANKRLGTGFHHHSEDLAGHYEGVKAAMQLGGDNYSLDYGRPWDYIALDRYLQKRGVPVFIWGASVGPFEADPEFAPTMYGHLKTLDGIFVRETETLAYLERHGVSDNVQLVADPAFVMTKFAPADPTVRSLVCEETIGINISPLVARFSADGGTVDEWREKAAKMIIACGKRTGRPILLIPHVASPKPDEDDYAFLQSLQAKVGDLAGVSVGIAPALGAAELKWIIGHCAVFAGARTHSTIAALSSHVPTLSLSYSVKSIGINKDIFGHQEFCHSVKTITPDQFAEVIAQMIDDAAAIRAYLDEKIPGIQARARSAGTFLRSKLEDR